ncbi:MAG: beta strand repeat-containing protein, partial [Hassallia sp.]
ATGTVTINQASRLSNTVADNATGNAGNISIKAGEIFINNQGSDPAISTNRSLQGRGGNVSLESSGSIFVTGQSINSVESVISTFGGGQPADSGDISLNASGAIKLDNAYFVTSRFWGNGGNISLQGNEISLANNSSLASVAFNQGNSGSITLNSSGPISIQNTLVNTAVGNRDDNTPNLQLGKAGDINISGRSVSITGCSEISSRSFSGVNSGNINVNARELVEISGNAPEIPRPDSARASDFTNTILTTAADSNSRGNAGNISIKAGEILINNQGRDPAISTNSSGQGRGGNVLLQSKGSIFVTGQSVNSVESVISTFSGEKSPASGDISLNASGAIKLDNAFFVASSFGGNGGNISLEGNEISLANNSSVIATAFIRGNSGSITLNSSGLISIQNTLVSTAVGIGENTPNLQLGNAGDININGRSVSLTGGSEISSRSFSGVNSGNINVNATELVSISGNAPEIPRPDSDRAYDFTNTILTTAAESNSRGNAGNISIKAGEIFINNQGSDPAISTNGSGQGRGGNVSLQASGSISLNGRDTQANDQVISTFGERNSLGSGDIFINANGSISLDNAFLRASTTGGDAGSILVRGNEKVSLANNSALTTEALGRGNAGLITVESFGPISLQNSLIATNVGSRSDTRSREGLGNAGNIRIQGRSVAVTGGSEISSRSFSGANSGNIEVNGTEFVDISGRALQFPPRGSDRANSFPYTTLATTSEQLARGVSGDITVKTANLRISDGASVRADTRSNFSGGSININANVVDITSGGQIFTTAFSSGNAGNIELNVSDRLNISGRNPSIAGINQIGQTTGIFANTSPNSTAQGGNLTINTPSLQVQNGATISVSSPDGQAGNLNITAKTIRLNQGSLTAKTAIEGQEGANILLQDVDLLLLQNNSLISAIANGTARGGNIIINAKKGFVIAPFGQNSDIRASAFRGRGGNITINTQGLFGFFEGRAIFGNSTNDIDASSEFNNPGTVDINTLDIDPRRGLLELPASVVEVSRLVASNCGAFAGKDGSSFTYTGRSGLPDSPDDFLTSDVVWSDTRLTNISSGENISAPTSKPLNQTKEGIAIIPATGWVFNNKGEVTLIASETEIDNRIAMPTTCQSETVK